MILKLFRACLAAIAFAAFSANAQIYPSKVIKIVVPYPPGGSTDIVGRYIGQKLQEVLNTPVIIDNKPGAGTNIGTESVVWSSPDGYTLLLASFANGVNKSLFKNMKFDPTKELVGVSLISLGSIIMAVPPDFPAKNVQEFIAASKAQPGKLNYGVGGAGSSAHLAGELFKSISGIAMEPVLYKGGAAALQDLIAGRVHLIFDNPQILIPLEKAGRVKLLAVTGKDRAAYLPNLPTMMESGVGGYEIYSWYGLMAPAKTPPEVIKVLERAMEKIAAMPEVKAKFTELGISPIGSNSSAMTEFFLEENRKWEKVVKEANIQLE
ncbi:MAG: tripartite tricarboxylate transporter substrate binding protein [Betaproteobacteria bacterium]|nr:tripartite tricarboxylate transporter substrate binding protein [Betaproteobacteria bacterium]